MRNHITALTIAVCIAMLTSHTLGQANRNEAKDYSNSPVVVKMMAFDKNKDGKLTRDEITDERLFRLFDQADTNRDGVVTRQELMALAAKLDEEIPPGRGGPGGFDDAPFGPGGPGGRGPGGRGGPGFGGPPQPGQVLSPMFQEMLNLTADQKQKLAALQKDVDARLAGILTDEQLNQLKQMRERGPRGRRGNGGPPPPPPDAE